MANVGSFFASQHTVVNDVPCVDPLAHRNDDKALMTLNGLALIIIYTCVLVIKTCNQSAQTCAMYGFDDAGTGAENLRFMNPTTLPKAPLAPSL